MEKQIIKEEKLKAYHITDAYSYTYLMKELKEQGYKCLNGLDISTTSKYKEIYPYIIEKENKKIIIASDERYNFYKHECDLTEYKKEETKHDNSL